MTNNIIERVSIVERLVETFTMLNMPSMVLGVGHLKDAIDSMADLVLEQQTELMSLENSESDLESRVMDLETDVSDLEETIFDLEQDIVRLEAEVSNAK